MSVEPLEELPGATYKGPALPCRPDCDIPSPFYPTAVSFRLSSSAAVQPTHNLVLPCQIRCRTNVLTSSLTQSCTSSTSQHLAEVSDRWRRNSHQAPSSSQAFSLLWCLVLSENYADFLHHFLFLLDVRNPASIQEAEENGGVQLQSASTTTKITFVISPQSPIPNTPGFNLALRHYFASIPQQIKKRPLFDIP